MILKLMKIYKNRPINNMTYTVFSKNNCSFCDRAINLIEDNDHAVIIKKIDEDQAFFLEYSIQNYINHLVLFRPSHHWDRLMGILPVQILEYWPFDQK